MMLDRFVVVAALLSVAGCPRPRPEQAPASGEAASASAPSTSPSDAAVSAPTTPRVTASAPSPGASGSWSLGAACSRPGAVEREGRTLAPDAAWETVSSSRQRLSVRVPPGVFRVDEGASGLSLVSDVVARGLGPDGQGERRFAIRLERLSRSIDAVLADDSASSPLAGLNVDTAFPERRVRRFVTRTDASMGPGTSERTTVDGRPAYRFVNGVEGYDSDGVLVDLGPGASLLIVADFNTAVMAGQPECWQRSIIAGVVRSVRIVGGRAK